MWGEEEDFSDHDYYNSIPGKEPPIGGVVDSRLRSSGALLGHIHTQPQCKTAAQVSLRAWLWLGGSGRGSSCGSTGVDFKKDTVDSWYLVVLWQYILYIFLINTLNNYEVLEFTSRLWKGWVIRKKIQYLDIFDQIPSYQYCETVVGMTVGSFTKISKWLYARIKNSLKHKENNWTYLPQMLWCLYFVLPRYLLKLAC